MIDFSRREAGDPREEFYGHESFGADVRVPCCIGRLPREELAITQLRTYDRTAGERGKALRRSIVCEYSVYFSTTVA